ncbi:MAG: bifunctional phosphopantothenoylcysteine decarboxylase/phosphopantothenate--cysteine ligase CoaBC [Bacteroidaceae bacterium]|jgi:phosphopantothenoylcysteine decarboxylase/phosphopantothenate--cysteine ligase
MPLTGKKIILGITGSIAAYKAAVLARLLIKKGAEVQVVITPAGKEFITPLTLATLTRKPVISDFFSQRDGTWNSHVDLGLWADLMLIAPATASTIGKMAHGIADNMLVTTYLSAKCPVFIAPAMDLDMYAHPATQRNLAILRNYGNHIIEPSEGELASQLVGKGRMEEPEKIVEEVSRFFIRSEREEQDVPSLVDKKVLITAGPTYERIDPVRFVGNYSSGKMGFALAEECAERGAEVLLVAGPVQLNTVHSSIRRIDVESASDMYQVAVEQFPECDVAILAAAVADFTPDFVANEKIKREDDDLVLQLRPTQDIAMALGALKTNCQTLVGFALETENEAEHARAKLQRKNFDFIVLNSLRDKGAGFRGDTNKITILTEDESYPYPLKSKEEVAMDIIDFLEDRMSQTEQLS